MKAFVAELHQSIQEITGHLPDKQDFAPTPNLKLGDFAFPCFKLAKTLKKSPADVARDLSESINARKLQYIASSAPAGPYINVFLRQSSVWDYFKTEVTPGSSDVLKDQTIVVDFSSPNVAKEIALHHLRSTAIGHSLARIAEHHGAKVVRINYLGDWGTSFGKLIVALQMFGKEADLRTGGLGYMLDLYVRFNQAEKDNEQLSEDARAAFLKLESGDDEARRIWKLFREISVTEYKKLYARLGVDFDFFDGESIYEDRLQGVIEQVSQKIGTRVSDGALVCDLPGSKLPVLLRKDDGASLYITRDLAAAQDRYNRFRFSSSWYVVAVQQKLHFEQLFALLKELGLPFAQQLKHVSFGMLSFEAKTMKSREGNVIFLRDVLDEAERRAAAIINEKNPSLPDAQNIAAQVALGAILFSDLSQNRLHNVNFSWESALSFEGDTSPFIQYSRARCLSVIQKTEAHAMQLNSRNQEKLDALFTSEHVRRLSVELGTFSVACSRALDDLDPSQIASSALNIAKAFNSLYHSHRFLDEQDRGCLDALRAMTQLTEQTLARALWLLGIPSPAKM